MTTTFPKYTNCPPQLQHEWYAHESEVGWYRCRMCASIKISPREMSEDAPAEWDRSYVPVRRDAVRT